jgi:hypothetical protein
MEMPGFILHVGATMTCTHMVPGQVMPSQGRVLVTGQPAALFTAQITVAGCPFQIPVGAGTKPQPCVLIKWLMPSARVMSMGQPFAVIPSPGAGPAICQSVEQIPQGPPQVSVVQARVIAM